MKFSKNAVDALNGAAGCARQLGHDHIGAEHILLSLLAIPNCQACKRLVRLGLSLEELSESMRSMITGGDSVMMRGQLPLSSRTKKILDMRGLACASGTKVAHPDSSDGGCHLALEAKGEHLVSKPYAHSIPHRERKKNTGYCFAK